MPQIKIRHNTEIMVGSRKMRIWFPRGQGRCAYLDIPPSLKGRVRVLRKKKKQSIRS